RRTTPPRVTSGTLRAATASALVLARKAQARSDRRSTPVRLLPLLVARCRLVLHRPVPALRDRPPPPAQAPPLDPALAAQPSAPMQPTSATRLRRAAGIFRRAAQARLLQSALRPVTPSPVRRDSTRASLSRPLRARGQPAPAWAQAVQLRRDRSSIRLRRSAPRPRSLRDAHRQALVRRAPGRSDPISFCVWPRRASRRARPGSAPRRCR